MASVYKAYKAEFDRYIALKVLPRGFLHDDTFAKRFEGEARVVASLEHPNIVPIYRYGISWMAMRMFQAGSLADLLRPVGSHPTGASPYGFPVPVIMTVTVNFQLR